MDEPAEYVGVKAIDTLFDGYNFRSRLEARWAVFFKTLGIPYQYEPEGFNLDGLLYLPDFWLPDQEIFIEVKGPFTNNKGDRKARALAEATGHLVHMIGTIPSSEDAEEFNFRYGSTVYGPDGSEDEGYWWCRSTCCGKFDIQYCGRSERIPCCKGNTGRHKVYTQNHPSILVAYMAARQHRFDGGNNGKNQNS